MCPKYLAYKDLMVIIVFRVLLQKIII